MAALGKMRAEDLFSLDRMVRRYEKTFEQVAAAKSRRENELAAHRSNRCLSSSAHFRRRSVPDSDVGVEQTL